MIGERQKALLQAAATIYAAYSEEGEAYLAMAVSDAVTLLDIIEGREKGNAPTSKPLRRPSPASGKFCAHNIPMSFPCASCEHDADDPLRTR